MKYSRRQILDRLAFGSAMIAMPLGSLTGCSAMAPSKQSYLSAAIKPHNRSTVFRWTDIMLQAIRNQSFTPPPATRVFAMAHAAGFLAVNGIQNKYNTPFNIQSGPSDADPEVAYASAFSSALSEGMQSSFIFDRNRFLSEYENSDSKAEAINYGRYAANIIIKSRVNDGAEPNKSNFYLGRYPRRDDVLKWSPTGPFYEAEDGPFLGTFNRGLVPGWGAQKPWVMKSKKSFLANDFLDPASPEFARQYNEVLEIGASDSKIRTKDQTEIAFFWEDGPRGVTPPGHWLLVAMNIIQDMNLPLIEQARLFALMSLSQADAAITTWDSKYTHDIVRPETFIRFRSDKVNNPRIRGKGRSNWRSLIFTPDFPAYTSGHSTFSGVSARMIANFIGKDNVVFSATAPDLVNWPKQLEGVRRSWKSIWEAAEENGASRIYGGVHWDADNVEGLRVGKNLADYIFVNAFSRAV